MQELWSMLHFLMPELFSNSEDFNEWFALSTEVDANKKLEMVKKLHLVLKPFMLRRVKADLAVKLPDKIEINVPLQMTPI